ncbi:hypothetical protein [Arthrobacter sp. D5-1]|uniref:hypothetical protein n=1 Tax=Arthrobacter sp. D5-1 TaxID=1477518 RepID=UPI001A98DE7C|nr:hypothetical protein [Arthrobacter sp. D5-1]QSZ47915.1 hypothetical protein AYX22_05510 [Arthrobacter sp. D5-1]
MKWLTDIVGYIVPVVTIVGSLLGILIALDQITAASRLRRRAVFWREMASQSNALPRDVAVFQSLQREATARVIALQLLPARRIIWPAITLVFAISASAMLGFMVGQIPPNELTWDKAWQKPTDETGIPFYLVMPSVIGLSIVSFINMSLSRGRIIKDHLNGKNLRTVFIDDAYRTPVDSLGWAGFLQVSIFSLGLAAVPAGIGGIAAAGIQTPLSPPLWAVLFAIAGPPILLLTSASLISKARGMSELEWQHPRPLAPRLGRSRSSKAAGTSERVHTRRVTPRFGRRR